jgi:hypothetical protein
MDAAKFRILAGIAGLLFGLAGVVGLGIASVLALSLVMGPIWGSLLFGLIAMIVAGAGIYFFLLPNRPTERELDDLEDVTARAIADLPLATVRAMLDRQPLLAVAAAALAGYSLTRDPDEVVRHAQRIVTRFL